MKDKSFIKGAIILVIFNLIGKILGAVYRIPLSRILGSVGMGKYQLVFPLYCLILTVSTSGMPIAISKLVSEFNGRKQFAESRKLLRISIILLTILSIIGSVIVVFGARFFARLQGNADSYICYYGIAPAVLFVGVLSAFRGYFQGNLLMFPTAFSGFIEQIVKLVVGLYFASKLAIYGEIYAVFGALIGTSVSEFCAFLFLLIYYIAYSRKHKVINTQASFTFKYLSKQLVTMSTPITLGGLISPMTSMIDSVLVINILILSGFASETATMMLGLQAGIIEPLVNIPTILSISIATALLPSVSKINNGDSKEEVKGLVEKALQISLSLSITFFICFIIFGKQIISFLYGSTLRVEEFEIVVKLLFLGSINIIFLSIVQVLSSVLQGLNYHKYPVKTLLFGCVIKIILDVCLISVKSLNIMGAVISGGVCYFVVMMLNYRKVKQLTGVKISDVYFYISIQECFVCLFAFFVNTILKMIFGEVIAMFLAGTVAVLVFLATYYVFFMPHKNKKDTALST